ncbi:tetratricopeptide repeat protein [Oceanobacillus piezotolerans]|uniref:Tetratricopeptide repeat protein n=1 Tax=Oceanobacillus piezotolerans TaxID=2448030 RepID=A0A498D9F3_9BACI|nr:tetratricopeptide repeat protein [Oceanobacillus piezotolerans]RLL47943.1 tetratricopeptide repeat protein [Oceanobacillus piezotolerans]
MYTEHDNLILFPKWKKKLEEESLQALKDKQYDKALVKLDKLIAYQVDDHEIVTGKLICLMELGRFNEAQSLCEELMQQKGNHYYHYVHIYLTILFQTNQYELLMEQIEYEFENDEIPKLQREQFKQLYDISEKMRIDIDYDKQDKFYRELFELIEAHRYQEQWRAVEDLRKVKAKPTAEISLLLCNDEVHPVTKTAIFQWLREENWNSEVQISKQGKEVTVFPDEVEDINDNQMMSETLNIIKRFEEKNPTFYQLLKELLYRYTYVIYPILPEKEEYIHIANALVSIGNDYLNLKIDSDSTEEALSDKYKQEIMLCESLYLSIIEA